MTDFETPTAPEYGHAGALPPPDSAPVEQPEPLDPLEALAEKAVAAMSGESTPEPAPQATEPDPAQEPPETPPPAPEERTLKLKVGGEERELTESEVLKLASQGADYTRKTQELARERDRLSAYGALMQRIETDPAFRAHVFQFQGQPTAAPEPPHPPTDPIERLKWEAVQEAKAEIMREMAPIVEQIPVMQAMQRIEATKASVRQDPMAPQVVDALKTYVAAQPAPFRARIFRELDTDPDAFMATYQDIRARLIAHAEKQAATAAPPTQVKQAPPSLESSGAVAPVRSGDETSIRALRKEIKSGAAGPKALERFLNLSGAFDRLT